MHTFVATKDVFCRDKYVFVATKILLGQLPPVIAYLGSVRPAVSDCTCNTRCQHSGRYLPVAGSLRFQYARNALLAVSSKQLVSPAVCRSTSSPVQSPSPRPHHLSSHFRHDLITCPVTFATTSSPVQSLQSPSPRLHHLSSHLRHDFITCPVTLATTSSPVQLPSPRLHLLSSHLRHNFITCPVTFATTSSPVQLPSPRLHHLSSHLRHNFITCPVTFATTSGQQRPDMPTRLRAKCRNILVVFSTAFTTTMRCVNFYGQYRDKIT